MKKDKVILGTFAVPIMTVVLSTTSFAQSANTALGPQVDRIIRIAQDSERVEFALTLPPRDPAGLQQVIKELYNPRSPSFRRFLSVAEFEKRFAPTEADYDLLKAFAVANGLSVVRAPAGRSLLDVSANVATIRKLFKTQMYWRETADGRQYVWADREPTPASALAPLGANAAMLRQYPPRSLVRLRAVNEAPMPNAGTGLSGSYEPSDMKTAYDLDSIQNGGTPVALYEESSATYTDAATYASTFKLNSPTIIKTNVDGGTANALGALEVMLDIEMVMAISNPTSIYVYTANPSGTGPLDTYQKIANDNLVGQVSSSWYTGCETDVGASTMNAENEIFAQMVTQGMAVFIALGDHGAYNDESTNCVTGSGVGPQLLDPGSQPLVTSAGGTSLTSGAQQQYSSEAVWNDADGATGGGVSEYWPIPDYQSGLVVDDTQYSTSMRNAPDFSLNADPATGYYIYCSTPVYCGTTGGWLPGIGGTSAVAPQLAAFWSLVSKGLGRRAGFANPTLYAIYSGSANQPYASDYHAITTGNNGYYDAFSLYDNATGIGSYDGAALYKTIVGRDRAEFLLPVITLLLQ